MIKLKFTFQQLKEFYQYLIDCVKSIKYSIQLESNVILIRKLNAELSEFNTCLLKVQNKVSNTLVLNKYQKTYTIGISFMQGYLITTDYECNTKLNHYISAILCEKANQINKQLI